MACAHQAAAGMGAIASLVKKDSHVTAQARNRATQKANNAKPAHLLPANQPAVATVAQGNSVTGVQASVALVRQASTQRQPAGTVRAVSRGSTPSMMEPPLVRS
eukprot:COSAG05_NODE_18195_length_312_cov_0.732394_1_plen_103_part_11